MKVCVVGGAGYLGSVLVPRLIEQGHDVTVIDDLIYSQPAPSNVRFLKVFVTPQEAKSIMPILADSDAVFWLAAFAHDPARLIPPIIIGDNNFRTPLYYARQLNESAKTKFLVTSSLSIFSGCDGGAYPKSKWALESELFQLPNYHQFVKILRFGTLYGPSPIEYFRAHLLINSLMIAGFVQGKLQISSKGLHRPILSIDNAVMRLVQALEVGPCGTVANYHQTSGTLLEYATTIKEIFNAHGLQVSICLDDSNGRDNRDYGWGKFNKLSIYEDISGHMVPFIRENYKEIKRFSEISQRNYYGYIKNLQTPTSADRFRA